MILTCALTVPCLLTSSPMISRLKECPTSSVHLLLDSTWMPNSAMGKLCAGRRGSVAKTCFALPGSRHPSVVADRAGLVATSLLKNRSNRVHTFAGTPGSSRQPVGLHGYVRQKAWEMRRHHELLPLSCIDRSQRGKGHDERKEERDYHDQPESRTDCRGCSHQGERRRCMSKMRPRTLCLQHRFGADSTLSWMDSRRKTVYADQSMPQWSHNPWRVAEYQPYRRWKFSEWFWWPRNTPKTRRWHTGSTSCKTTGRPRCKLGRQTQLGHRNSSLSDNFSINSISIFNINRSSWRRRQQILGKCFPRTADPLRTAGVWTRERIGLVCNRPIQHNVRVRKHVSSTGLVW